jgi:uncharacterized membrane protein YbaN (DUF454 family)
MNGQKLAVGTIVGGITCFIAGFLLYGLALNSFMMANAAPGMMKEEPVWLHLIIGNLASGALLTVVIGYWAKTGGVASGFKIGAQLGLLMMLSFDFMMFATSNVMTSFHAMLVDVAAGTILNGAVGAAVGAVLGPRK